MKRNNIIKIFAGCLGLTLILALLFWAKSSPWAKISAGQRETFFEQFFIAGGPVVWFVLFPMSLVTVYLMLEYTLSINRRRLLPQGIGDFLSRMAEHKDGWELLGDLKGKNDLVSSAIRESFEKGAGDWFRTRSMITESFQEHATKLMRRIEWLNLIGSVSPMVGLFGTVFGMIKLFNAIVTAGGQPQPAQLADGIGVALVTTFWGLFIAIPALAVYGIFRNNIERIVSDAVSETEKILPGLQRCMTRSAKPVEKLQPVKMEKVPVVAMKEKSQVKAQVGTTVKKKQ